MFEINACLYAYCSNLGVEVGRKTEYNPVLDQFRVIGKSKHTGKAQDFVVEGWRVAKLIVEVRKLFGGKMDPDVRPYPIPVTNKQYEAYLQRRDLKKKKVSAA